MLGQSHASMFAYKFLSCDDVNIHYIFIQVHEPFTINLCVYLYNWANKIASYDPTTYVSIQASV